MATYYNYELWNGEKILGYYSATFPIRGKFLFVRPVSTFKQLYDIKPEIIKVPIITRVVSTTATDVHSRIVLDVRKKSKRQIGILMRGNNV